MVGGEVIGVTETVSRPGEVRVLCSDRKQGSRALDLHNACYVWVEKPSGERQIEMGDGLWWHGSKAMWTPKENKSIRGTIGVDFDIQLQRIGYSVGANL